MSLFQESIIRKHLGTLDQDVVDQAYVRFKEVYSANKITNIKVAKEEQYQEGFIKDIFGSVLGYSVFPEQPFNIQTEKKNEADSKKADGAIFQGENVVGVIELKDNKTKNLDAVKDQAFGYKNNHRDCSYVISSNFHKLRFYVDDATEYEEFDLYNLDKETFKRFYLYLRKEGLLDKNIPKLLRQETKFHEENITKSLYKDYSSFKNSFFQNVVVNNPQYDKLLLFKKSQKFLDKLLFVLFAEDKGLVTTNSIVQIVEKWNDLKNDAFDTPKPLYQLVVLFFNNLFKGKYDQKGSVLIPEFGGEIFAPDEVLDTLIVDDSVLKDDLLKLSRYDFNTDVDVNILGHIFEHSLSEIEEVESELKGEVTDKTKGKRKKDGVFYTPKFITKYIVENTVGKLCSEKKSEMKLDIDISIFEHQKTDGKLNTKGIELYETLNLYKSWLLTLKILDPSCGSGAFLNEAVNFLVQEHQFIDDIIAELTNTPLRLFDTDLAILENNIYGVDINEESIEIAKLSLWLRTAKQGRKLSNLSNNIKCGNSIIDDPTIAGDKAFHWQNEFPEVFAKGGFDVVIGNPPYVDIKALPKSLVTSLFKIYKTADNRINLFSIFIERSLTLLKSNGKFSFIIPSALLTQESYKPIRTELLSKTQIDSIIRLPNESFGGGAGEVKVDTIIFTSTLTTEVKSLAEIVVYKGFERINEISIFNCHKHFFFDQINWTKDESFIFRININDNISDLLLKIENQTKDLSDCAEFCLGLTPYDKYKGHTAEQINNRVFHCSFKKDETYKKLLAGNDVIRYNIEWNGDEWISYGDWLGASRQEKFFKEKRILVKQIIDWTAKQIWAALTIEELYNTQNAFNLIAKEEFSPEYLLALINSKLMSFYHRKKYLEEYKDRFQKILIKDCKRFPIKLILKINQETFIEKINLIIVLVKEFREQTKKLQRTIQRKFDLEELPKKLQDWYLLSYPDFIKELAKKKIKLSLSEEAEWESYFITEAKKALDLKAQIEKTDKEIDQMVYALYDLTEDEIKIVEGS